jgi:hypothetical protein
MQKSLGQSDCCAFVQRAAAQAGNEINVAQSIWNFLDALEMPIWRALLAHARVTHAVRSKTIMRLG